jgi:ribonuclease HI
MTIHTDGAARGNPGPAAYAFVIEQPGKSDVIEKACLGNTTNNVAEYTAVVRALERARELGGQRLNILSDSELMVKQMMGQYKVRNEGLLPLYQQARKLVRSFEHVNFQHVRREENSRADRLCNEALDGETGPRQPRQDKPRAAEKTDLIHEQAIQCLRTMAGAWSRGNPQNPRPEDVWEQLWSILEEGGVIRPGKKN